MGNTKRYYLEGVTAEPFTEAELLAQSGGTYAALKWDAKGYLGQEKAGAGEQWFCGALHSYSMNADQAVKWLVPRCLSLYVIRLDTDWSDCAVLFFEAGVLTSEARGPADGVPTGGLFREFLPPAGGRQ